MNEFTLGRRMFAIITAALTIVSTVGLASFAVPQTASAATMGTDVRSTSLSTVYYYAHDGMRYTYPDETTYMTWEDDFDAVETISDEDLAAIAIGGNAVYRAGSYWVKIVSDPKTYAVSTSGTIHWIESEAVAVDYAGDDWNTGIRDVPDVFFVDYTAGASLMTATAFDGMMFMDGGSYYLAWGGEMRMVDTTGRSANRMDDAFFLDGTGIDSSALVAGADITAYDCTLVDVSQTGCAVVEVGGDLSVGVSTSTPAGVTVPKSANAVEFASFDFTAGADAATINNLTVKLAGLGATADIDNVFLYEGESRLTEGRSLNTSTRTSTFGSVNLVVAAGTTRTISVRGNVASGATTSNELMFQIVDADAVEVTDGTASGSFPLSGNTFAVGGTTVGSITIAKNTIPANPTLGDVAATIGDFKVTGSTAEDGMLQSITLKIEDADHSNHKLWLDGVEVAAGEMLASKLVLFDMSSAPIAINKNVNKFFKVTADIGGKSTDSVKVYLDNTNDMIFVGNDFGYNLSVTSTTYDGETCTTGALCDGTYTTIQGGDVTMQTLSLPTGSIKTNSTKQVLYEFSISAGQEVTIKDLDIMIMADDDDNDALDYDGDGGDDDDGLITTTEASVTNIALVNKDTGATVMGPLQLDDTADDAVDDATLTGATEDALQIIDFSDDWTLGAGETINLQVQVDIADTVTSGTEFAARVDISGFVAEDKNADALTNATDVIPTGDLVGNNQEAVSAALTVTHPVTPGDHTVVKGARLASFDKFSLAGGKAGTVTISSISFDLYGQNATYAFGEVMVFGDGTASDDAELTTDDLDMNSWMEACYLYDKAGVQVNDSSMTLAANGQTLLFDGLTWEIGANVTEEAHVKCDIGKPSTTRTQMYFGIDLSDVSADIVATDEDGLTVTATGDSTNSDSAGTPADGSVLTSELKVVTSGAINIVKDATTPTADIFLTGSTGNVATVLRAEATDEDIEIQTLTLAEEAAYHEDTGTADSTAYMDGLSAVKITYPTADGVGGAATAVLTANEMQFTGLELFVEYGVPSLITATVDIATSDRLGGTADSNQKVAVGLSVDVSAFDQFKAIGLDSGFVLSDTDRDGGGTNLSAISIAGGITKHTIRQTAPTFSTNASSPSGTNQAVVDREFFRYNVAANSAKDVLMKQIVFKMNASDNSSSGWNFCDDDDTTKYVDETQFKLYDYTNDAGTVIAGTFYLLDATGDDCLNTSDGELVQYVQFVPTTAHAIPAGDTHEFSLWFLPVGAATATDDSVQFSIVGDPISTSFVYDGWTDTQTMVASVGEAFAEFDNTLTVDTMDATTELRVGDILCLDADSTSSGACASTEEQLLVTKVTNATTIEVVRGYNGTPSEDETAVTTLSDLARLPSTFLWDDDGTTTETVSYEEYWGSYLVNGLPVVGGGISF
jgi:hypothetical protein